MPPRQSNPERFEQAGEIYHLALERPAVDRAAFLTHACGDDRELREEVASLLAAHDEGGTFLSEPAMVVAARLASAARAVPPSLHPGTHIGPYAILDAIGAGGMGEVYRARDSRLGRLVAIKVLPGSRRLDPDRRARFEQEARALASLNHPNIASLYDLEESMLDEGAQPPTAIQALVMELVEGPTLAERLARGPIPLDETLSIARQIVNALEAAHAGGIVHRDLKPANIKLRPDGTVKVLDFGLAKALGPFDTEPRDGAVDEGTPRSDTALGTILGTSAYMSPEQATGKGVDHRTDIWAFGCVFYEMLAGHQAFGDPARTASVDLSLLPKKTPPSIRVLISRCLQPDARKRLNSMAHAHREIADAEASIAPTHAGHRRKSGARWAVAAAALLVAGGTAWTLWPAPVPPRVTRHAIAVPPSAPFAPCPRRCVAISPDGSRLAYITNRGLAVRALDQLDVTVLPGVCCDPFFSPDGRWIGYTKETGLFKVPATGGTPSLVAHTGNAAVGHWTTDGILFSDVRGLFLVPAEGGEPVRLPSPPLSPDEQMMYPYLLPEKRGVLFTVIPTRTGTGWAATVAPEARIDVLDLATGAVRNVVRGGGRPFYLLTGHVVYGAEATLRAIAFDLDRLQAHGESVQVAKEDGRFDFGVSDTGMLLHAPGSAAMLSMVWVDRQGREEDLGAPPNSYATPRLSPDGTRVGMNVMAADRDVWIWDMKRKSLDRFTVDSSENALLAWTLDGKRIAFGSSRAGGVSNIYWQAADGTGLVERLTNSPIRQAPIAFMPDGRLLFCEIGDRVDVLALSLDGSGRIERLLEAATTAELSPDGRWLAYDSEASGQFDVYVQPYGAASRSASGNLRSWKVSTDGGRQPLWSRDGRELFYRDFNGAVMGTTVTSTAADFAAGPVVQILPGGKYNGGGSSRSGRSYDLSLHGDRFLMIRQASDGTPRPSFVVVENWTEELKRLVSP